MKLSKKIMLSILAFLPLGAISYAAEFESNIDTTNKENMKITFDYLLLAEELPAKYYNYMDKKNIFSYEELNAEKNLKYYQRMLKEFEGDLGHGVLAAGGAISIGGTF